MASNANDDYRLSDDEFSPLLQVKHNFSRAPEDAFWHNYHRLVETLPQVDHVNLNIVNQHTGKINRFNNIRFDLKNFFQRH